MKEGPRQKRRTKKELEKEGWCGRPAMALTRGYKETGRAA